MRRRLKRSPGLAVVIQVPDESWTGAFKSYLHRLIAHEFSTVARTGASKTQDPSHGNDGVGTALGSGTTVVGISQSPTSHLPRALTAAADISIVISPPTGAVIKQAMRWSLRGRTPAELDVAVGLELTDIVAAMRAGTSPRQAVDRLAAAAKARGGPATSEKLPPIEDVASGPAREWALELQRDVALARQTGDFSGSA